MLWGGLPTAPPLAPQTGTVNNQHGEKWCKAVWDWLLAHGVDLDKAKWGGDKWILE